MSNVNEDLMREVRSFDVSVRRLSDHVSSAGGLWSGQKFLELSCIVSHIAVQFPDLLMAGESCCGCMKQFEDIAAERC